MAPRPFAPLPAVATLAAMMLAAIPAAASSWTTALNAGSRAEAQAQAAPSVPTGVSDSCVSPSERLVTVTWSPVAEATTYTVYRSTTTSTGSYTSSATGVTTTSWTSGTLTAGNYWYKVAAYVGTKWLSAQSAATGETTISTTGTECTQP